ncbi:MAG: glycine/sarcosine/betaine reductase selenoprotein B family protein [Desulfobacterales bacterium]
MNQLKNKLIARFFARYPSLLNRWVRKTRFVYFSDTPWTSYTGDPSKSRLALVTTGGVHLKGQPPFDMRDSQGDPSFREIPADAAPAEMTITHDYFDHRDADKDINILFPVAGVRLLERFGEIGRVNQRHFSFMGHIRGRHLDALLQRSAPDAAARLRQDKVDIVLLTPG